jgi:hypothetical protein
MQTVARLAVGIIALFNLGIGVAFWARPEAMAARFFVAPTDVQGLATVRADFGAFFIGAALFALAGAWRTDARPLVVPLAFLALALAGRALSLVTDGVNPQALPPMAVEVAMIAVLLWARRAFGTAR